jgi:hypothetical protein
VAGHIHDCVLWVQVKDAGEGDEFCSGVNFYICLTLLTKDILEAYRVVMWTYTPQSVGDSVWLMRRWTV